MREAQGHAPAERSRRGDSGDWRRQDLPPNTEDMFSSIASGDAGPLTQIQTSYATDMALGRMAAADRPVMWRLARWADDGDTDILRVNAAGILGKAASADFSGMPAAVMLRDRDVRGRWLRALVGRVGTDTGRLSTEVLNPADSGARWCAGGSSPRTAARPLARHLPRRCALTRSPRTSAHSASYS